MWFTLTLFWHSLILVHWIVLYQVVLQLRTKLSYILIGILWGLAQKMGISIKSGVVITYIIIRLCYYTRGVGMKQFFRFRTSVRQSHGILYIIPV